MMVSTGPLPLFACKCGHKKWAVSTKIDVTCGQCNIKMKCINYDIHGNFIEQGTASKKENEPLAKGPLTTLVRRSALNYKHTIIIDYQNDFYNPQSQVSV